MPQVDIDGANSKVSADKLQGQSGTTITVPTGHVLTVTDAAGLTVAGSTVLAADNSVTLAKMAGGVDGNIISYDASGDPVAVVTGSSGQVLTSAGAGAPPTFAAAAAGGKLVQMVNVTDSAAASGTTSIEPDDSIPTKTEGDEYMTLAITPTSASNILLIIVSAQIGALSSNSKAVALALFQDTTTNAIAATGHYNNQAGQPFFSTLRHRMVAGTTSATTFKLRAGANGSGVTVRFNSNGSGRLWGGVSASSMTIMEIEA